MSRDIEGNVLAIKGSLDAIKKIEASFARRSPTEGEIKAMDDHKETALLAGLDLAVGLLTDINRIANALEFVAKQHNSSEALFKA